MIPSESIYLIEGKVQRVGAIKIGNFIKYFSPNNLENLLAFLKPQVCDIGDCCVPSLNADRTASVGTISGMFPISITTPLSQSTPDDLDPRIAPHDGTSRALHDIQEFDAPLEHHFYFRLAKSMQAGHSYRVQIHGSKGPAIPPFPFNPRQSRSEPFTSASSDSARMISGCVSNVRLKRSSAG
jgi:hypothetical protein